MGTRLERCQVLAHKILADVKQLDSDVHPFVIGLTDMALPMASAILSGYVTGVSREAEDMLISISAEVATAIRVVNLHIGVGDVVEWTIFTGKRQAAEVVSVSNGVPQRVTVKLPDGSTRNVDGLSNYRHMVVKDRARMTDDLRYALIALFEGWASPIDMIDANTWNALEVRGWANPYRRELTGDGMAIAHRVFMDGSPLS